MPNSNTFVYFLSIFHAIFTRAGRANVALYALKSLIIQPTNLWINFYVYILFLSPFSLIIYFPILIIIFLSTELAER